MVDFRIYRAGFLPALVAVVVLLFALQTPPDPLPPVVAPVEFNQAAAVKTAHQVVAAAPERAPGSSGDSRIADLVARQFGGVRGGQVTEQRFSANGAALRNVILTLPGDTAGTVVVMASRDSATGPGAASSASATATLLELVNELRLSRHTKTLVFVSTDAGSNGALGAKQFVRGYPRDLLQGILVIYQPGSATSSQPSLVDDSDGPQSASAQLSRTARVALTNQTGQAPAATGLFGELARLAVPSGLGEQAPLIQMGVPAVALSSAGERPLPPSRDQLDDLSPQTLGAYGRAALQLVATMDAASVPLDHGPGAYLPFAGNLVPGWTVALLGLALLVPAALACVDAVARAMRAGERVGWGLAWSLSRALPLVSALVLLYLLAALGIVAQPDFPFDPNSLGVGAGEIVAMTFLALVAIGGAYLIRAWRAPRALRAPAAVPALGVASVIGALIAWLANPYLGLLAVPVAHVWLLEARRGGSPPWPLVALAAAIALVPSAAAFADLAARLDLGADAPWQLLLMVDDGQIGFWTALSLCLLSATLVGIVAVAIGAREPASRRRVAPGEAPAGGRPPEPRRVLDASPIVAPTATDDFEEGTHRSG